MKKIKIAADRKYTVVVDANWESEKSKIENSHKKVLYIIPDDLKGVINTGELALTYFTPSAEDQKTEKTLVELWEHCGAIGLRRDDAIVAIGGGATTDLAGFVAATWMRGLSWYSFPTSIAGAVDAAIGGKTGINSKYGKNLIGSFYSPNKVIIDLDFLKTLPERDFNAGMAEIIKCGFISDPKILELLEDAKSNLAELIHRAVKVKAAVVSEDFHESKLREILNYGHTLGHAIENRENYKFRHGEAIAIGLVFAAELSGIKAGLKASEIARHRELLTKFNLPIEYRREALPDLITLMQGDKKTRGNQIRFIGIKKPGKVLWFEDVTEAEIAEAYGRIAI